MHNFYKFYYTSEATELQEGKFGNFATAAALGLSGLLGGAQGVDAQEKPANPAQADKGAIKKQIESDPPWDKPVPLDPKVKKVDGQNVDVLLKSTGKPNEWIVCYVNSKEEVILKGKPYVVTVRWRRGQLPSAQYVKILGTIQTDGANKWWINDARPYKIIQ